MADLNARYGDKTELTWSLLAQLGFAGNQYKCEMGGGNIRVVFTRNGTGIKCFVWFSTGCYRQLKPRPATLGDLYRLADALGVKLREEGNG